MKKNLLEWIVFGVSLALIAGMAGVVGYEQMTRENSPPQLSVVVGEVVPGPDGFSVELVVENSGDRTAESVQVEASLEGSSDRVQVILQYVPYRSKRRAWVMLSTDPRRGRLVTRVLGFEEP
jgi:uncharacterized protein (TIGR02588 family)